VKNISHSQNLESNDGSQKLTDKEPILCKSTELKRRIDISQKTCAQDLHWTLIISAFFRSFTYLTSYNGLSRKLWYED